MMSINEFVDKKILNQRPEDNPDPIVQVNGYGRMRKSQCRKLAIEKMGSLLSQMNHANSFNHNDYDLLKSFMDALI